jgi:hypothetical protein
MNLSIGLASLETKSLSLNDSDTAGSDPFRPLAWAPSTKLRTSILVRFEARLKLRGDAACPWGTRPRSDCDRLPEMLANGPMSR